MKPLFSIIVPTYNRYALLQECISSVQNQTCEDWELIIVDDGSTDETAELVFPDERIAIIHQHKSERSEARNLGIDHARGQFILFIDDDDFILKNHLSQFREGIEREGREVIYRTGFIRKNMDGDLSVAETNYSPEEHKNPVNFAAFNMCGVWSLCIPARFLTDERFPVGFPHWQDTHLILRLFTKYEVRQLPDHTYVYRVHKEMGSRAKYSPEQLLARAQINTAAITDLFDKYGVLVRPYLPEDTEAFLYAEKYLEYAQRGHLLGYASEARELFAKVDRKMWFRLLPGIMRYWWYGLRARLRN